MRKTGWAFNTGLVGFIGYVPMSVRDFRSLFFLVDSAPRKEKGGGFGFF